MRHGDSKRGGLPEAVCRTALRDAAVAVRWSAVAAVALIAATAAASPAAQQAAAEIRGVVHDEDGNPLAGARVFAWPALGPPAPGVATTSRIQTGDDPAGVAPPETISEEDGAFRLPVAGGVHHVLVRLPGYRWGHRLGVDVGDVELIDVGAIEIRRGVAVSGVVRYSDRQPVAGIPVGIMPLGDADAPVFLPEDWIERPSTVTAPDGRFRFDGLAPASSLDLWYEPDELRRKYRRVSTPATGTAEHQFELVLDWPRVAATGMIEVVGENGEPIEGAGLLLEPIPRRPSAGGSIRPPDFRALPGGRYELLPRRPGLHRLTVRAPLHRGHARRDLELVAGDNGIVRIELPRMPSTVVAGVLTTAEALPIPQHELDITRIGSLPRSVDQLSDDDLGANHVRQQVVTDAEGRFEVGRIPEGRYELTSQHLALGRASQEIAVAADADASVVLAFPPAEGPIATIHVRVLDAQGSPVADARVRVSRRSAPNRSAEPGTTDPAGRLTFQALADDADHVIRVSKSGFESTSLQQRLDEEAMGSELLVTLPASDRPGSTVVGRLIGVADELHRLRLTESPSYFRFDGSFVIHGVPPGEHEIRAVTSGRSPVEPVFTVSVPAEGGSVDVGDIVVERFDVAGTVEYKGEPLSSGSISLRPADRGRHYGRWLRISDRRTLHASRDSGRPVSRHRQLRRLGAGPRRGHRRGSRSRGQCGTGRGDGFGYRDRRLGPYTPRGRPAQRPLHNMHLNDPSGVADHGMRDA